MQEIYERANWLAEMEELGEAKPHRQIIHSQIAERLVVLLAFFVSFNSLAEIEKIIEI